MQSSDFIQHFAKGYRLVNTHHVRELAPVRLPVPSSEHRWFRTPPLETCSSAVALPIIAADLQCLECVYKMIQPTFICQLLTLYALPSPYRHYSSTAIPAMAGSCCSHRCLCTSDNLCHHHRYWFGCGIEKAFR